MHAYPIKVMWMDLPSAVPWTFSRTWGFFAWWHTNKQNQRRDRQKESAHGKVSQDFFFCEIKHYNYVTLNFIIISMLILVLFFDNTFLDCKIETDLERIKFVIPFRKEQDNRNCAVNSESSLDSCFLMQYFKFAMFFTNSFAYLPILW